jgi:hypothetical protein
MYVVRVRTKPGAYSLLGDRDTGQQCMSILALTRVGHNLGHPFEAFM